MRGLSLLLVTALAGSAAASPSNPAFLGISFGPSRFAATGAEISTVTPGSPAARAGLIPDDVILTVDGKPIDVTTLNSYIVAHDAGDPIELAILRNGQQLLTLTAILTTRANMFDHLLGHPLPVRALVDSESKHDLELSKPTTHPTVLAWFSGQAAGGAQCVDPVPIVHDVARRVAPATVIAVTYADPSDPPAMFEAARKRLALPLALTTKAVFSNVAIAECGRVFAMVLDTRGLVTFLTPISDGEDEDAALDELAIAAAQAAPSRR